MKRKTLDKQIKNLEKQRIDTEEKGFIQGSEDTNYIDILKEAKSRNVGIMDFFYREEMVVGKKKKVIEDVFYGDKQRISMIVEWFEQISEKYIDTKFDVGKLMHTFGEKTGRQILQSLFTSKSLDENHLYKSAYETLWNNFRKTLVSNEEDKGKYRYFVREGIKQFHYVFDLLILAKLLG
ncbi:MAG: hypothetical protein H7646_07885 [Candidatus Heimdallarchaeota archaeon]|nr:hypothetical protein [Candidatus Heimdallarchaeota archaeon]